MTVNNKEEHLDKLIGENDFLARYVTWALWALAVIVIVATITGQVESYNGLYIWFATHHVTGFWADFAPLTVDSFTVIGELAIFAGIARHWDWPSRILPWASAMLGICSSVAANIGDKVQYHSIPTDLTGAIFPLAGAFGIVIGLGVLKRVARDHAERKAKKNAVGISQDEVAMQLMKDNEELARHLEIARAAVTEADKRHLDDTLSRWKSEGKMDPPAAEVPGTSPNYPSQEELKSRAHFGSELELKGLDVLIPPRPPVESEESPWKDFVQPATEPTSAVRPVQEREEAQRRLTDIRGGRPIINPSGLDVHQTGSFPAIPG